MSSTKTDKIRTHYDMVADTYDYHYDHRRGRKYHTHLSNHLMKALPEGGNLLDIGCGTGLFVEKYIRNGGNAVGLDISGGAGEGWKAAYANMAAKQNDRARRNGPIDRPPRFLP